MKRVLALVGAVAMIVGALVLRGRLDDGGGGGADGTAVVACVPEARAACDELAAGRDDVEVRIERYDVTSEALVGGESDIDAWLVPAPLAADVDQARALAGQDPVLGSTGAPIARSGLVVVGWRERLEVLRTHCGGQVDWVCIGESADAAWTDLGGQPTWGALKPGLPPAGTATDGLLLVHQATAARLGTTDYASNDFGDPAFRAWFDQLVQTADGLQVGGGAPLARMLSQGVAAYDLVGALEADAVPAVRRSRDRDRLEVLRLAPDVTVDLVAVPVADAPRAERAVAALRDATATQALAAAGWRVPGQELDPAIVDQPALPDTDGAPFPGVLLALRSLWQEAT